MNRGGFLNSEMLALLLCTRAGLPFLGASPILRGLADDKHLAKLCAAARDIPTAPWTIYRRGAPVENRSSPFLPGTGGGPAAGWWRGRQRRIASAGSSSPTPPRPAGPSPTRDWPAAAVADIHRQGHDAIVEPFLNGSDVEVR